MKEELQTALTPLYFELLNISEETYLPFCMQWGSNFPKEKQNGLLFVGKATNGWEVSTKNIDDIFKADGTGVFNRSNQMRWVEDTRYYSKSAFWRVVKKTSQALYGSENWYENVAWSNLYKLSHDSGNPKIRLRRLQEKLCLEILKEEIRILSPKIVVFLTSGWDDFFFQSLNIDTKSIKPVTWSNRQLTYFKHNDITYIRSLHPERKPEGDHIQKILSVIKDHLY